MRDRQWTAGIGVLLLGLSSLSACNLEVNIHLDASDEPDTPAPAPDLPASPSERASPPTRPVPTEPPSAEPSREIDGVIRDALWRPQTPRVDLARALAPADGRRPRFPRGRDFVVAPRLLNPDEVAAKARDAYPPLLLAAGVEGTAEVEVHVDASGRVGAVGLTESSRHPALDAAALQVAFVQRFEPARNGNGTSVAVWSLVPITFQPR
jgi:TonB family protein